MPATNVEHRNEIAFVYFNDTKILDSQRIELAGQELRETLEDKDTKQLVLNFRGVTFMSSAMITKLVVLDRNCKAKSVPLRLCGLVPSVLDVFKITNLNRLFKICDSEEQAIVSLDSKGR